MWHMISIVYKDCRGCKGGIHHSFKQKTLTQMGSTRVVVVTSVGMKMENVYNSIRVCVHTCVLQKKETDFLE